MNERIKELEIQAADGTIDPNEPFTAEEFYNFTKKFAELIIQECIDELDGKIYNAIDHEGDETWPDLILKEHFGIEE